MRSSPLVLLLSSLAAAAVSVLATRAIVARKQATPPAEVVDPGPDLRDFTAQRKASEFSLSRLLEEGRWEAVEEEAGALLHLDPINEVARGALERSRSELDARDRLVRALDLLGEGREEAALRALLSIPAGTEAALRARVEAEPLAERVARRAKADCLGLSRAGRYEDALDRCRLHLDLTCARESDPAIVERLRWLERKTGARAESAWICPARSPAGLESGEARVREVLRAWERGEAGDHAALRLERLAARGIREAERYLEPIRRAEARLREALAALLEGELERAREALERAGDAEEEILGKRRSARYRESSERYARLALERGLELEAMRRFREAREVLSRAAEVDPANPDILRALWRVEDASGQ